MGRRRFAEVERRGVAAGQRWCCAICQNLLDAHFEIDHKIPLAAGGRAWVSVECVWRDTETV